MRKVLLAAVVLLSVTASAQRLSALELLKENPRKAYGNDFPYEMPTTKLTKAPHGYKPFYISLYARHGSRYSWSSALYKELDTLLTIASDKHLLTPEGEGFCQRYMAAKDELLTGVSELTDVGWKQHQDIARSMYNNFPEVFEQGGNILAISSLVGRCVLSMSAFCQELVQCNPRLEIREQSSRFTLDGVVPSDHQNPVKHHFPKDLKPRYEKNMNQFKSVDMLREQAARRVFISTDSLPLSTHEIGSALVNLYQSLPSIGHEGMMGNIINDEELAAEWEGANLGAYSWVFGPHREIVPVLQDILKKAAAVIKDSSNHLADLRFGHDGCIGPLTVLMGINGADMDPEDPYEVKNCYQNWETCKASNIQLVFYRSRKAGSDVLVKCLLNGREATLPVPTDLFPYYRWGDFLQFYTDRCKE